MNINRSGMNSPVPLLPVQQKEEQKKEQKRLANLLHERVSHLAMLHLLCWSAGIKVDDTVGNYLKGLTNIAVPMNGSKDGRSLWQLFTASFLFPLNASQAAPLTLWGQIKAGAVYLIFWKTFVMQKAVKSAIHKSVEQLHLSLRDPTTR